MEGGDNGANFTDQGIRNYKDTMDRATAFKGLVEQMGGTVKSIHWTMGPYDLVTIVEAPDDETAVAAALMIGAQGNVRTTTMPAFGTDEIGSILEKTS